MSNNISIAMTTFNGAAYLSEQLESFINQNILPDEVVICDDGSTDETIAILKKFKLNAPFIVRLVLNEVTLGFTRNFEKTITLCSGKIILLADQDDVWFPEKIEKIFKFFETHLDIFLIVHDGILVDSELKSYGVTMRSQVIRGYGSDVSLITGAITSLRRELIQFLLPIPESVVGHDIWFHGLTQLLGVRTVMNEPLQFIRRHEKNTSNWIASSPRKIGKLNVFASQLSTKTAKDYLDRKTLNSAYNKRIHMALKNQSFFSTRILEKSLVYLKKEAVAINHRNELAQANWIWRKALATRALLLGEYYYFNGLRSFLRDLMR